VPGKIHLDGPLVEVQPLTPPIWEVDATHGADMTVHTESPPVAHRISEWVEFETSREDL
jgi:hypothetical protein